CTGAGVTIGIRSLGHDESISQKPSRYCSGGVAERSNAAVLKCDLAEARIGTDAHSRTKLDCLRSVSGTIRHDAAAALLSALLSERSSHRRTDGASWIVRWRLEPPSG